MLDGRETEENLRDEFPTDRAPYTWEYDYDSDSDLGDDDKESSNDELAVSLQAVTEMPGNGSGPAGIRNLDVKSSKPSEIVSIPELGSVVIMEASDGKIETNSDPSAHVGKVVVIEDVAFVT